MSSVAGPSQPRKRAHSDVSSSNRPDKKLKPTAGPARKADKKKRRKKKKKGSITANISVTTSTMVETVQGTDSDTLSATSASPQDVKGKGKAKEVIESPEDIIRRQTEEIQAQSLLLKKHEEAMRHVQQAMTCQICLDVLRNPYALTPCGHVSCHGCLFRWFSSTAPGQGKTCPHCRSFITKRPVEIWTIKHTVQGLLKSGLLTDLPDATEHDIDPDPWKDLFGTRERQQQEDDQETTGVFDPEDNVYRCQDCMHEIWNGACTGCERVFPNNQRRRDEHGIMGGLFGNIFGAIYDNGSDDAISVDDDEDVSVDGDEDDEDGELRVRYNPLDLVSDDEDEAALYDNLWNRVEGEREPGPFDWLVSDEEDDEEEPPAPRRRAVMSDSEDGSSSPLPLVQSRIRRRVITDSDGEEDGIDGDNDVVGVDGTGSVIDIEAEDDEPTGHVAYEVRDSDDDVEVLVDEEEEVVVDDEDDDEDLVVDGEEEDEDDVHRYSIYRHQAMGDHYEDSDEGEEEDDGSIPGPPAHLRAQLFADEEDEEEDDGSIPGPPAHLRAQLLAAEDEDDEDDY